MDSRQYLAQIVKAIGSIAMRSDYRLILDCDSYPWNVELAVRPGLSHEEVDLSEAVSW